LEAIAGLAITSALKANFGFSTAQVTLSQDSRHYGLIILTVACVWRTYSSQKQLEKRPAWLLWRNEPESPLQLKQLRLQ
jgi:hypothetical protein